MSDDQARTMFKALTAELIRGVTILRDLGQPTDQLEQMLYCINAVNREADALAARRASAPSNEGAGVAGASVS